jgi:hypothetical protein
MFESLFGASSEDDNPEPAAKKFPAAAPAVARSANLDAGSSTDSASTLLATLELKANEALERDDYKLVDYLFEKAERLRNQLQQVATPQVAAPQVDGPAATQKVASHAPAPPQGNSEVLEALARLERGGISVPVPEVKPNDDALNWDGVRKKGSKWPFKGTTRAFEIDGFMSYLKESRRNVQGTLKVHQRGLNYAFRLVDVGTANYSDIGVFVAIHDTKIMQSLREKPIVDLEPTWTRVIVTSLSLATDYLLEQCERNCISKNVKYALTMFKKDVIEPWVKDITFKRKEQKLARGMLDQERLKNYMPVEFAEDTVKQVMVDLYLVWFIHEGSDDISHFMQTVANICMAWMIVVTGTFARSGEMANLTAEEVDEALAAGREWLRIIKHKTFKTQGPLGRHLVPGSWIGVRRYNELPPMSNAKDRKPKPFLKPACPSHDTVDMYRLLQRGGAVLCPDHTFPRTQLNRKWMSKEVRKDENQLKCAKWVADWNAHLETTGEDFYDTDRTDPEQQAIKGKQIVNAFFGEQVNWPQPEDLPVCTKEEATQLIIDKYGKHVCTNGEDKEGGEDTDGDNEEEGEEEEEGVDADLEDTAGDSPGNGKERGVEEGGEAKANQAEEGEDGADGAAVMDCNEKTGERGDGRR